MSRKLSIDTLRGLACILLVAHHVIGHDTTAGLRLRPDHILPQVNEILALLRMPLFSFLSGFVYAWRPYSGDAGGFLKGKVRRLLVPMLLVGTLFAVMQANTPGANASEYDWRLLHIVPVAHYWFLESLFVIFMLTVLLERLALLATPDRFAMVWLVAGMLYLADPMPYHFGLQGATYLLPFFLLGLGSNRFGERLPRGLVMGLAAAMIAGLSLYLLLAAQAMPHRTQLTALLISACTCLFLVRTHVELRWLAWIGIYSFAIYLFHTMFSAGTRILLLQLSVTSVPVLFTLGLVAGVLGPIAAAMILRRVPWGHLPLGEAKPRRERRPSAVAPHAGPTNPG
jgi:fucose 4-O-acetylase-like acetyltransferase